MVVVLGVPNLRPKLLAALKQPQSGGAPAPPPTGPPAGVPPIPPMSTSAQPPPNPYYGNPGMPPYPPPPAGMPQYPPPMPPPQPTQTQPGTSATSTPSMPNLPPNLMAMLQHGNQGQNQQQSPPPPPQVPYNMSMPPQGMVSTPPIPGMSSMPATNGQGGYQQLMAYLVRCHIVLYNSILTYLLLVSKTTSIKLWVLKR